MTMDPYVLPTIRVALYVVLVSADGAGSVEERLTTFVMQWLFSVVLLGLTAARIHYTEHLPPFDPLNNGHNFYGKSSYSIQASYSS